MPPTQTTPPLYEGSDEPPLAPWLTQKDLARSPPGANQTLHPFTPGPVVPQTPPSVASRFPALPGIRDEATCLWVTAL